MKRTYLTDPALVLTSFGCTFILRAACRADEEIVGGLEPSLWHAGLYDLQFLNRLPESIHGDMYRRRLYLDLTKSTRT